MPKKATDTTVPAAYVAQFVDAFGSSLTVTHLAQHMACTELEALADLLDVLGYQDEANAWRSEHAQADDDADDHGPQDDAGALITTH